MAGSLRTPSSPPARARVAAVGVSLAGPCGVRDYAALLGGALPAAGIDCSLHWTTREEAGFAAARAHMRGWLDGLRTELREQRPEALLLHYSVFPFAYRGMPVFVRPTLATLRELGVPIVTILHEPAYPWHLGGARGKLWALSHRALLVDVMRSSAAVAVTADFRAEWLSSRRWLPRRRTIVSPVFPNLPPAGQDIEPLQGRVGLFGYAHEGIAVELVLDAMRLLEDRGIEAELALLGAPGPDSVPARRWLEGARARGLRAPRFSGEQPAQVLADELARCEILLSADHIGPTSRRTTLAASLASGRAVVASDGRRTWPELRAREASRLVEATDAAMAHALAELLTDRSQREQLGARGREFATQQMSTTHSAQAIAQLLALAWA